MNILKVSTFGLTTIAVVVRDQVAVRDLEGTDWGCWKRKGNAMEDVDEIREKRDEDDTQIRRRA